MLKIGEKVFLNLQEAVGWLLANNALPFQSTANYVADTEIAKTTIVNPSPAEIKVGALVLFADSKVGTVSGLTSNGFMVSSEHTDIQEALAYIASVNVNASGHLITTLSDGTVIDAGILKQVSSLSINASQHLIANYNDGTSTDLGAIFSGNVNISGNLTADSIVENMTGYSFEKITSELGAWTCDYAGVVKTGNKITFVVFGSFTYSSSLVNNPTVCRFTIPTAVHNKLYPYSIGSWTDVLLQTTLPMFDDINSYEDVIIEVSKSTGSRVTINLPFVHNNSLVNGNTYLFRFEFTFLLSDSLA